MVKCKCCSKNTSKRIVLNRKEPIDITNEMPSHPDVKKEFLCINKIKSLHPIGHYIDINGKKRTHYEWFQEICENHMIILNKED